MFLNLYDQICLYLCLFLTREVYVRSCFEQDHGNKMKAAVLDFKIKCIFRTD